MLTERPGKTLKPFDLEKIRLDIEQKFGSADETDVASFTQYPKVYEEYRQVVEKYGDLSILPTRYFLSKPEIGEEFNVELEKGKVLIIKLLAVGPVSEKTGQREVFFEMNGEVRTIPVEDKHAGKTPLIKSDHQRPKMSLDLRPILAIQDKLAPL